MFELNSEQWLQRFEALLVEQGYRPTTIKRQLSTCDQFLLFIADQGIAAELVTPANYGAFIDHQIQCYQERNGHDLRDARVAKHWFGRGVAGLLRFVQGQWPPTPPPANELERLVGLEHHAGTAVAAEPPVAVGESRRLDAQSGPAAPA